jgi:hypothetical protein
MNHRTTRLIFAFGIGLLVAVLSFKWITDPAPRAERALEESTVAIARQHVQEVVSNSELEFVDPLSPDRKVGKSYVYRATVGWEVSGYYRRGAGDRWHPFLMELDGNNNPVNLKVQDAALAIQSAENPLLEVLP